KLPVFERLAAFPLVPQLLETSVIAVQWMSSSIKSTGPRSSSKTSHLEEIGSLLNCKDGKVIVLQSALECESKPKTSRSGTASEVAAVTFLKTILGYISASDQQRLSTKSKYRGPQVSNLDFPTSRQIKYSRSLKLNLSADNRNKRLSFAN